MNVKTDKLLPLGSIVLLEDGLQKLVVVGRGAVYTDQETGEDRFADYMGAVYPMGMNPETTIFFQHKDIEKVVFEGYSDEDEIRFLEIYAKWKNNLGREKNETAKNEESFGF